MKVACYTADLSRRSEHVAKAMRDGFVRHGIDVAIYKSFDMVRGDVAVAYGWSHQSVFSAYRERGLHFIYIDLGFWLRKPRNASLDGYHKVSLDDWCPTAKMRRGCPADRFNALGVKVSQQSSGDHILIAGMSEKASIHHGLLPSEWEKQAVATLQSVTGRRLVYRPKPSWRGAVELAGADFSTKETIEEDLVGCHALVTHHSNAAVDAIVAGVPVYCQKSVGSLLSTSDLATIEHPYRPADAERMQFLHDVAYVQYTPAEMRSGLVWDQLRSRV